MDWIQNVAISCSKNSREFYHSGFNGVNQMEEWELQLKNVITKPEQLADYLQLSQQECSNISKVTEKYRMVISPYYARLISGEDNNCPIRKQCIPRLDELVNSGRMYDDPLHESVYSVAPHLVHKYPDRVAFFASNMCFMFCRHCTRKNTVISKYGPVSDSDFEKVLHYIKNNKNIRDVLITGGDPLTLTDEKLEKYISEFRKIDHVQTIRIGTRAIVTCPMRITEKLADMLMKYHPIWINTQFNHPREITPEAAQACNILLSRGIPVGNQTVLLNGINNDLNTMEKLFSELIRIRVRPYYLYQCDYVKGVEHFITPYTEGVEIISELRGRISGYAIPHFIIDVAGEDGGKIVAERSNIVGDDGETLILRGLKNNLIKCKIGERDI